MCDQAIPRCRCRKSSTMDIVSVSVTSVHEMFPFYVHELFLSRTIFELHVYVTCGSCWWLLVDRSDHSFDSQRRKQISIHRVIYLCFVFSVMASHSNQSPKVLGPLSSMFSEEARAAILAEEQAEAAQHTADIETATAAAAAAATAAETSTAEAATATVEAMGSQGLPAQHRHVNG